MLNYLYDRNKDKERDKLKYKILNEEFCMTTKYEVWKL